ncbi:MAG: reverse transcriptase domain-containing protein [Gemmataceae bacterium]
MSRYKFVAKIDIKRFFDEIDHEILKFILREKLEKLRIKTQVIDFILEIISNFLKITPKMKGHDSKGHPYEFKGIPQGGPLSTLVSNLYLDVLDKEFHRNNVEFIRYADDIIIFSESREIARNNLNIYELFLKNNLCLNVGSKNNVHSFEEGFDYLGFHFKNKSKLIREKTIEKFKDKIRQITIRKNKKRILFSKLNRYIKTINMVIGFIPKREKGQPKKNLFVPKYAWAKYFCLAYEPNDLILKQLKDLDCFIRDRLRRLYCLMFNKSIDFKKQDKSKTLFINKTNRKFKHNGLKTLEESFFRLKRD